MYEVNIEEKENKKNTEPRLHHSKNISVRFITTPVKNLKSFLVTNAKYK